jgi:hypothetical protein
VMHNRLAFWLFDERMGAVCKAMMRNAGTEVTGCFPHLPATVPQCFHAQHTFTWSSPLFARTTKIFRSRRHVYSENETNAITSLTLRRTGTVADFSHRSMYVPAQTKKEPAIARIRTVPRYPSPIATLANLSTTVFCGAMATG